MATSEGGGGVPLGDLREQRHLYCLRTWDKHVGEVEGSSALCQAWFRAGKIDVKSVMVCYKPIFSVGTHTIKIELQNI